MDFERLFTTVLSEHHDYFMRTRRFEEGGYEIVSFSHFSEFVVIVKYADNLDQHFDFMRRKLSEIIVKPVRCEVHFQKPRKVVSDGLRLHRWGDYATILREDRIV